MATEHDSNDDLYSYGGYETAMPDLLSDSELRQGKHDSGVDIETMPDAMHNEAVGTLFASQAAAEFISQAGPPIAPRRALQTVDELRQWLEKFELPQAVRTKDQAGVAVNTELPYHPPRKRPLSVQAANTVALSVPRLRSAGDSIDADQSATHEPDNDDTEVLDTNERLNLLLSDTLPMLPLEMACEWDERQRAREMYNAIDRARAIRLDFEAGLTSARESKLEIAVSNWKAAEQNRRRAECDWSKYEPPSNWLDYGGDSRMYISEADIAEEIKTLEYVVDVRTDAERDYYDLMRDFLNWAIAYITLESQDVANGRPRSTRRNALTDDIPLVLVEDMIPDNEETDLMARKSDTLTTSSILDQAKIGETLADKQIDGLQFGGRLTRTPRSFKPLDAQLFKPIHVGQDRGRDDGNAYEEDNEEVLRSFTPNVSDTDLYEDFRDMLDADDFKCPEDQRFFDALEHQELRVRAESPQGPAGPTQDPDVRIIDFASRRISKQAQNTSGGLDAAHFIEHVEHIGDPCAKNMVWGLPADEIGLFQRPISRPDSRIEHQSVVIIREVESSDSDEDTFYDASEKAEPKPPAVANTSEA
ncbi:hypothetical protein E8E12_003226 [Didymella heteroderae]|uniref:Uncharacterized protein n=1 Tax=Didymella heteroderae TaxID=1769908 RepID=A0A9P4WT24_9PLEO|nr:hypothetical protein E8E12_003226 [Didymella heteroderae]